MNIPFSPPLISEPSIESVVETLRSGWITSGPKVARFEEELTTYMHTDDTICLNSATAALESALRVLGIGPGDEVITSAYTYTASASVIDHVGAKIVLVDTDPYTLEMDPEQVEAALTENTKAIIPVDIAGVICNYERLYDIALRNRRTFKSSNPIHHLIGRIAIISDGAHSFGASRKGEMSGTFADFTAFSFHAVKNLTTAEGGALTWRLPIGDSQLIKERLRTLNLHGQTKDARAKMELGNWEYDIEVLGYKNNLTDIAAAIGLEQLKEYSDNLKRRHEIIQKYDENLDTKYIKTLNHKKDNECSSGHLYLTWVKNIGESERNEIIKRMAEHGIATNVHFKPLPLFTAYKNYGFDIKDYPNAFNHYKNEITLPLYPQLTNKQVDYIIDTFNKVVREVKEVSRV